MGKLTATQTEELRELLDKYWKGDKKMVDHCMKFYKYIYLDGMYIDCCNLKPTISKTLWYDDEQDSPGDGYNTFIAYNLRLHSPDLVEPTFYITYYIRPKYVGGYSIPLSSIGATRNGEGIPDGATILKPYQIAHINEAIKEVRADYRKRLDTYFKKYKAKIHSSGYWVNR